ncbi:MAG: transglycosylase domain-containing protein, partial [Desulfobulbaceae bacterium]|nr:transglycosylase domain-containing protein [Desulfobulbaceae bacterium]
MADRKRKEQKRSGRRRPARGQRRRYWRWGGIAILLVLGLAALYVRTLDQTIRDRFEGKRWDLPARVYARPLELYVGLPLTPDQLVEELRLAGYRRAKSAPHPGSYGRNGDTVRLNSRPFYFGGGDREPSRRLAVTFAGNTVAGLTDGTGTTCPLARLDPAQIGSFHPLLFEDRIIVTREAIPDLLRRTLVVVEDRNFYLHHGIDPLAILRSLRVNVKAGTTVQGGSTLTQQLVKNLFLDNRRTLWRKANEAVMALLLELHYDKEEILTAYINEVFLGQDGDRAIHGFALAGHFYFRRDLADLTPGQIALLVGLVKGPSFYDPRQHAERATARRNLVLEMMARQGVISQAQRRRATAEPVMEPAALSSAINRFPAFLDLVKRQLLKEYQEKDLTSNGIRIFTTLDPLVQRRVEETLERIVPALERGRKPGAALQAAVVVVHRDSGEIEALAGDRRSGFAGFNRALDARRPIGSLVKPAVYLSALEQGYTLATPLVDR